MPVHVIKIAHAWIERGKKSWKKYQIRKKEESLEEATITTTFYYVAE